MLLSAVHRRALCKLHLLALFRPPATPVMFPTPAVIFNIVVLDYNRHCYARVDLYGPPV